MILKKCLVVLLIVCGVEAALCQDDQKNNIKSEPEVVADFRLYGSVNFPSAIKFNEQSLTSIGVNSEQETLTPVIVSNLKIQDPLMQKIYSNREIETNLIGSSTLSTTNILHGLESEESEISKVAVREDDTTTQTVTQSDDASEDITLTTEGMEATDDTTSTEVATTSEPTVDGEFEFTKTIYLIDLAFGKFRIISQQILRIKAKSLLILINLIF